jgi:hypothetical protein
MRTYVALDAWIRWKFRHCWQINIPFSGFSTSSFAVPLIAATFNAYTTANVPNPTVHAS